MRTELLVESQIVTLEFDRVVFLDARYVLAMRRALDTGAPEQALALAAHVADQADK